MRVQHVVIHDRMLILLVQWAWLAWLAQLRLTRFTLTELAAWFRGTLVMLGLPPTRSTPAGLRAGGATYASLSGSSVEQLMWRGRWETLSSLRLYIQ